jgi:hypothetical protein
MGLKTIVAILAILSLAGCTTSRWVANPNPSLDIVNGSVLNSEPVITIVNSPTPESPFLHIEIKNNRLLEVPMVYESVRVIQRYRPRYGLLAAGILASTGLILMSETLQSESELQNNLIKLTSAGVLAGSALSLKPDGNPIQTGERRRFGQIEKTQIIDSLSAFTEPVLLRLNAAMEGESLISGREFTVRGSARINLVEELGLKSRTIDQNYSIQVQLVTENEVKDIQLPVSTVMKQYIRVIQRGTPVRSSPVFDPTTVITTVASNSYLPFIERVNENWYRTMLGATTAYVSTSEGEIIWRVSSGQNADFVVATAGSSVDIEKDIPQSDVTNSNTLALIITQENYPESIRSVGNAHRSGDLFQEYMTKTLGIPEQNIIRLRSAYFPVTLSEILKSSEEGGIAEFSDKNLIFYYAGAARVQQYEGQPAIELITTSPSVSIRLDSLISQLSALNTRTQLLVFETDFSNRTTGVSTSELRRHLNQLIAQVNGSKPNSAIILAGEPDQIAGNYQSNDLRTDRVHGIMTYYLLQSLKNGATSLPEIRDALLRNVTFTSRRLHNRAQDPIIRFNTNFDLKQ